MKPMIILPPDVMSEEERKKLEDNGICVVVSSDPAKVRFVDPIPAQSSRTDIENAAIRLSRKLLNWPWDKNASIYKTGIAELYVEILTEGTPLDRNGTREEQETNVYNLERTNEIQRIAREDARREATERKEKKKLEQAKKA